MTIINKGWIKDNKGEKFAPKTLSSQVIIPEGVILEDLLKNSSVEFNLSDNLIHGANIENQGSIGSVLEDKVVQNVSWYYLKIPVRRGETYKVVGKGGYGSRLWALTNRNRELLSLSEPFISGEYIITVTQDGYLYFNTEKVENFGVYKVGIDCLKENFETTKEKSVRRFSWTDKPTEPYWILALDCAKKYFSINNIKTIIDRASSAGFNQLQIQLTTNKGFRFALDDMIFTDINGTSYDLTPCLGGVENPTGWYTVAEMDDLITYSKSKGLDFYPFMPMPTHMLRVLTQFPQFQTSNSSDILNVADETAVNFSLAILDRYAKYFASRGCHFFNFGFDEDNFTRYYNDGKFNLLTDYGNLLISTIKENGLQPRMYNDGVMYNKDSKYQFSRDVEVLCWKSRSDQYNEHIATFNDVQKANYKVINSASWFYYIDGAEHIPTVTLETLDVLKFYDGYSKYFEHTPSGAVLSIWCDNSVTTNPGDNGDAVVADTEDIIEAFGGAIKTSLRLHDI